MCISLGIHTHIYVTFVRSHARHSTATPVMMTWQVLERSVSTPYTIIIVVAELLLLQGIPLPFPSSQEFG